MISKIGPKYRMSLVLDENDKRSHTFQQVLATGVFKNLNQRLSQNETTPISALNQKASFLDSGNELSETEMDDYEPFRLENVTNTFENLNTISLHNQAVDPNMKNFFPHKSLALSLGSNKSPKIGNNKKVFYKIPCNPYKILDIPGYHDDFYSNQIAWSSQDQIATALYDGLYLFDNKNSNAFKLYDIDENESPISAVTFSHDGNLTAVGTERGSILIFDITAEVMIGEFQEDDSNEKVTSFDWHSNGLLAAGKDLAGVIHDFRKKRPKITEFVGHSGCVCNIKWARSGLKFATGGSDHKSLVWDLNIKDPLMEINHKSEIRALAWSSHRDDIIATGGGANDCCLKVWNVSEGTIIEERNTGSPILNIIYSQLTNDLITTHSSLHNEINLWRARGLKKVGSLQGHEERALTLCLSPDMTCILTASADETMQFWKLFDSKEKISENANKNTSEDKCREKKVTSETVDISQEK
jgi:cell division cycle 20-like protein 1 (cofactor of APC complex)